MVLLGPFQLRLLCDSMILCSWQEFTAIGSSNTDTGKASGSLETKYKDEDHGLTFTHKWNTDNTLGTEVSVEDQVRPSRYFGNVSTTGMRQYGVEQKTLENENCTKLSGVLKEVTYICRTHRLGVEGAGISQGHVVLGNDLGGTGTAVTGVWNYLAGWMNLAM